MRHAKRAAPAAAAAVAFFGCRQMRHKADDGQAGEGGGKVEVACGLQPCKERERNRGSITYTCALLLRPFPPLLSLSSSASTSSVVGGPAANVSAKYETEKSIKSTLLRQPIAGKLNETTEKARTHTHRGMVLVVEGAGDEGGQPQAGVERATPGTALGVSK